MSGGDDIAVGSRSLTAAMAPRVNVSIVGRPPPFFVHALLSYTVKDFKLAVRRISSIPPERQLLIFNGRVMTDDQTLSSYGLQYNGTVDLLEYRDAGLVNANLVEDLVGNLENSGLENLASNRETLRIKYSRLRAICDRNLSVLSRLNDPRPTTTTMTTTTATTTTTRNIESSSHQFRIPPLPPAGRPLTASPTSAFHIYRGPQPQTAFRPPLPGVSIRSNPPVRDRDTLPLQSMHPSNPQSRDKQPSSQAIHQVSTAPKMLTPTTCAQTESEPNVDLNLTLNIPQKDAETSQNDGGPSGDVERRFFLLVQDTYADQLSQLQQMGFTNINENTRALFGTVGDVEAAAKKLRRNQTQ